MKKFTKIALIVCAVCLVLGLILVVIGSAFGARSVGREYLNDVLELDDLDDVLEDHHEPHEKNETKTWDYDKTFEDRIRSVEISMNFGQVDIKLHDQETIRVAAKNAGEHLKCSVTGSELSILDKRKSDQSQITLTVYLPKEELEELDIEMGAGVLYAGQLQAREFGLEVGAGECIIDSLTVSESAELHVAAGRIQVDRFDGCYLDGECGAGELDLTLAGVSGDYNYEVEVAMGEIKLGEDSYSGLANEHSIHNGAHKNVELECAMGSISVDFENK